MAGTIDDHKLVQVLRALADAKRFRMVQQIATAGELSCGQVAERFALSQPTISHHLKLLGEAGVIRIRNEGQHRFISVDHELLDRVAGALPVRIAEPKRPRRRPTR
jgi:DNA-binding transcriptional ArsR family regulator